MSKKKTETRSNFQTSQKMLVHRSEISDAPYNPRRIAPEKAELLRKGIQKHGFVGGMVWNKQTGRLVSGHQRLEQLDVLEGTEDYSLEIDVVDLDANLERELNILLNSRMVQGEDDEERLSAVLAELAIHGRDVYELPIEEGRIEQLLTSFSLSGGGIQFQLEQEDVTTVSASAELMAELREEAKGPKKKKKEPDSKKKPTIITLNFASRAQQRKFVAKFKLDPKRSGFMPDEIATAFDLEFDE